MLKIATHEDIENLIPLFRKFFENSPYKDHKWDEDGVWDTAYRLINDKVNSVVITYQKEGRPVGIIAGTSCKALFSNEKVSTEIIWWVEEEYRNTKAGLELLNALEYWAFNVINASMLSMVCLENNSLERLYTKRGYSKTESCFIKTKGN